MKSSIILFIFIIEFFVLAGWSASERNWPQFFYGLGGAILNIGVLMAMAMKEV